MKPVDFDDLPEEVKKIIAKKMGDTFKPEKIKIFDTEIDISDLMKSVGSNDNNAMTRAEKLLNKFGHIPGPNCPACKKNKKEKDNFKKKDLNDPTVREIKRISDIVLNTIEKETMDDHVMIGNVLLWLLGEYSTRAILKEIRKAKRTELGNMRLNKTVTSQLLEFSMELSDAAIHTASNAIQYDQTVEAIQNIQDFDKKMSDLNKEIKDGNGN